LLRLMIAAVCTMILYAAVYPVAMGDVSSDDRSISLEGEIENQFDCPLLISSGLQMDLQIGFIVHSTVTFTGSTGDVQVLAIDLSGSNVSSEYSIYLDKVETYTIVENLILSIETNNPFLKSYLSSLTWEEKLSWEYKNETAGDKIYKLSSRISSLSIQISGDLEAFLDTYNPGDQERITITVPETIPQEVPGWTTVEYVLSYSAEWNKESSVADTDTDIPSNRPPVFRPIPDEEVTLDQVLQIVLSATDPDQGDVLTYSAIGVPMSMGAQLDGNVFTWQPMGDAQVGDYEVTFIVEDSAGEFDEQTIKISVRPQEEEDFDDSRQDTENGLERDSRPVLWQDKGRGKPDKIDVRIRNGQANLSFKGYLPSFDVSDIEALLDILDGLELSGDVAGISCVLTIVDEPGRNDDSGSLRLRASLRIGGMVISDDPVSCRFRIEQRRTLFKFYAEGQSAMFGKMDLQITGIITDGMVKAPMARLDIEYVNDILSEIGPLTFLSAIPDFSVFEIPGEVTIGGSFEGMDFAITLFLEDLVTKSQRRKTAISFTAALQLYMDGVQVDIPLECRFELKSKHNIFSISVTGKGTGVQKVELKIAGRITDDGIVTRPMVKLIIIFRPEELLDQQGTLASFDDNDDTDNNDDDDDDNDDDGGKKPKDRGKKKPKRGNNVATRPLLFQNFPNPFNPETWIPYQLHEVCRVTLRIYDVAGRLIRTLDLGYRDAGTYTSRADAAYWDGRNDMGEEIASGLYFYTIQAGDFTATRRMLILK